MLELYTPFTGLPDLEAKIAFGLVYIARQTPLVEPKDIRIEPLMGYYSIRIETDKPQDILNDLDRALRDISIRRLCEYVLRRIPGVHPKYVETYIERIEGLKDEKELIKAYQQPPLNIHELKASSTICGHKAKTKMPGAILALSPSIGKLWLRRDRFEKWENIKVCPRCFALALLGFTQYVLIFNVGKPPAMQRVILTPLPKEVLDGEELDLLVSAIKSPPIERIASNIPYTTLLLSIFAYHSHLAEVLSHKEYAMHIAPLSMKRVWKTTGLTIIDVAPLVGFIRASSFNAATVINMINAIRRGEGKVEAIELLNRLLLTRDKRARASLSRRFTRVYAEINLLYPDTADYLIRWCYGS